jgi:DNA-binding NarL/FixJ family response regulator
MNATERIEMDMCRVALLFRESLMLEGLCTFLEGRSDMQVTSLDPSQPDAAVRLRQWRPEVIIFDGEAVGEWSDFAVPQLLVENPQARLIDVNRHVSQIAVYEHHTVSLRGIDDLLAAFVARGSELVQEGDV